MNISKQTISELNELYSFSFWDYDSCNEVSVEKANSICIGFSKDETGNIDELITKTIKVPSKKEITTDYIINKLNSDKTYNSFAEYFQKLLGKESNMNVYPTTYGIGIFVAIGYRNSIDITKVKISNLLNELGVKYENEYSGAGWVFRYKISKTKENISLIESILINKF